MYFKKSAETFLILSIVTLFNKIIPIFGVKLDVFFVLLSAVALLVAIIKKEITVDWNYILPYAVLMTILVLSTVIGSLVSLHLYGTIPFGQIQSEYRILLGCLLIFFEILILGKNNPAFIKWIFYAFGFSLIIVITPYIPIDSIQKIVGVHQHRFYGLIGDANYYPTFMMLPTILAFYMTIKNNKSISILIRILFFIIFALTIALTYWNGSRSSWLGVISMIVLFNIYVARTNRKKVVHFFILTIISIAALLTGYFFLPSNAKSDIRFRLNNITTPELPTTAQDLSLVGRSSTSKQVKLSNGDNSVKTIPIIDAVSYNQDRLHIWIQGTQFFIKNPVGYGLAYYNIINIVSADNHVSAHSFILETLLIGGPLLFFSLLYILLSVTVKFIKYKQKNFDVDLETIVFVSLIGFLVTSFFLSSLLLRWFWIQLAVLIVIQSNRGAIMTFLPNVKN